ncbi:MAG: outer membrane protein assembly factor BamA, partial [Proteobacteria bacterium]|nr:outer membrane protein assembly factor BamA [Candidatus Fonsibacter sp. PEL4]
TFSINSGKKYKFGDYDLKITGLSLKETDSNEIKNISNKLLKNEFYSPLIINKLSKQVTDFLESKRYGNFEINIQDSKAGEDKINVIVQLNEGQKSLINKINIQGNTITEEKVIRDNLILAEGDQINSSKIKKSIDNVKSKQLFSKVDYKIEDSDKKNFKDFNLFVKEQPTGNISAGVGYGTNGGIFEAGVNERNFLGQGINLNFNGKLSTDKISGVFSYNDPNFNNSSKELAVSLYSEKDDFTNAGYENKRIGTSFSTKYEIYEDIFFRPNIGIQHDSLDITGTVSNLLRSRQGNTLSSSVGYLFSIDKRDSKFNPTSGTVFYFSQDIDTLISDVHAFKTNIGATVYKELINDKFIGSAKARLANSTAINNKDIKISDRLYSSSSDLRGFEPRGVGPVDTNEHIGGNNLLTLSLKSTFPNPIPDSLRSTSYLFLDMGNVWGVDYSNSIPDSSKIRSTTGIALDLMSPIGPLSFTYSIPISKASTDSISLYYFFLDSYLALI